MINPVRDGEDPAPARTVEVASTADDGQPLKVFCTNSPPP
jgi:hypothetical protein